jgi:hypothetical protein
MSAVFAAKIEKMIRERNYAYVIRLTFWAAEDGLKLAGDVHLAAYSKSNAELEGRDALLFAARVEGQVVQESSDVVQIRSQFPFIGLPLKALSGETEDAVSHVGGSLLARPS